MPLLLGEAAPPFKAATPTNPRYAFDSAAGRYLLLGFYPSTSERAAGAMSRAIAAQRRLFDDLRLAFFGVLRGEGQIAAASDSVPGVRWFLDADRAVSRLYEMETPAAEELCGWVLLDPSFRVLAVEPLTQTAAMMSFVAQLPPVEDHAGMALHAPVLIVPRIFEPEFCARLIQAYQADGGEISGVTVERDGRTAVIQDPSHKVRRDHLIADEALRNEARERVRRRLAPQIEKAFQHHVTRMERYLISCYEPGGFFRPHRDNTTRGTAHRRFAVTINLNAEDYDGGELTFPEFGSRLYRPPTGGAVVFSCSLLHEALPVTRGRRYAFLPFLYDEAAAKVREANNPHLASDLTPYDPRRR